ncbi:MAG TPA: zinc ribbon domain-containing protein [Bordetella sp.]
MSGPAPEAGPQQRVVDGLRQGRLLLQKCRSTGEYLFYPRAAARGVRSGDWDLVPACGLGRVYAATHVGMRGAPSYHIALVDLAEGPRLMARLEWPGDIPPPPDTPVRMKMVEPEWAPQLGHPVPVFEPAGAGGGTP